jgi:phage gpG-like protein
MQIQLTVRDGVTPELNRMQHACARPAKIMRALGTAFATATKDAFDDASLRPSPWAATKTGHRMLVLKGLLRRSIRVVNFADTSVTIGTDRAYAAFHQLGTRGPYEITPKNKKALAWPGGKHPVKSVTHPGLPPRPFFPVTSAGTLVPAAARRMQQAAEAALAAMIKK